jgi:hypothetical protein
MISGGLETQPEQSLMILVLIKELLKIVKLKTLDLAI